MAKRGLGRGLAALIPAGNGSREGEAPAEPLSYPTLGGSPGGPPSRDVTQTRQISVDAITANPYQPRTRIDEQDLQSLTDSILEQGLLQPVIVRPANGSYQLIAGERRWQAAKRAGLSAVPAIIRQCGDREMLEVAIVENLQREDINPLDAARAYRRLSDEFTMTQEQIAKRVGKSRPAIANALRLLDLPADVQQLLSEGKITEGHARAVLMCQTQAAMRALARKIAARSLSVREAERMAQPRAKREKKPSKANLDAEVLDLTDRLRRRFSTQVRITRKAYGGTIEIDYYNNEQLTRIADLLIG